MNRFRPILPLAILLGLASGALSQVSVTLKLGKRNYLHGEAVPAEVSITNMTGQELTFVGSAKHPWIDFIVKSNRGVPMTPVGQPAFGTVKIPAGKTVARAVDLNKLFSLNELGNYSVYALIRPPSGKSGGYQSQRKLFTVSTAKPYWSQVVGVPGRRSETREFRLIQFTAGRKVELYIQVADAKSGRIMKTHGIGESLMFRKPTILVDGANQMHVLYLVTPEFWGHAKVDPNGKFLGRDLYRASDFGDPALVKLEDGSVRTSGGVFYDPKAEAERRAKNRKASDRPAFIYE
ncbi:MAG: hypothetical protein AAGI48_05330 [Verrucomicrobiota bacterium]